MPRTGIENLAKVARFIPTLYLSLQRIVLTNVQTVFLVNRSTSTDGTSLMIQGTKAVLVLQGKLLGILIQLILQSLHSQTEDGHYKKTFYQFES